MTPSNPVRIEKPKGEHGGVAMATRLQALIDVGRVFISSYKNPDASQIADNDNLDVLFVTGDKPAEVYIKLSATGAFEYALYEDTTVSDNGTTLARRNRNRNHASIAPTVSTYHTPTVTNVGNLLDNELLAGILGGAASGEHWDLKPSTNYLIRIINRAGSAQSMSIAATWIDNP